MAVSADRDRCFTLRQVTAALSQDFPCELSFKRTFDRYGELRLVPVLLLELDEDDYQTLQDVAGVAGVGAAIAHSDAAPKRGGIA